LDSEIYTAQQLADMARRLDECIEVSALCMSLALAGQTQRAALAQERMVVSQGSVADARSAVPALRAQTKPTL
jgi:hypothetical protein